MALSRSQIIYVKSWSTCAGLFDPIKTNLVQCCQLSLVAYYTLAKLIWFCEPEFINWLIYILDSLVVDKLKTLVFINKRHVGNQEIASPSPYLFIRMSQAVMLKTQLAAIDLKTLRP